jgi:hypothetical protein
LAELVWLPLSVDLADDVMPPPLDLLPPLKPAPVVLLVPVFGLSELPLELVPLEPVLEALVLAPDEPRPAAWIAEGLLAAVPAPTPAELLGEAEWVSSVLSWVVEPCALYAPAPDLWSSAWPQFMRGFSLLLRVRKKAAAPAATVATAAAA